MRRSALMAAYGALASADVILAGAGARRARRFTKPLLMPVLAAHVAGAGDGDGAKPWVLAGLGLSCVGDIALLGHGEGALLGHGVGGLLGHGEGGLLGDGEGAFAVGLGSFLAAHGCYLAALSRRRAGGVRRAPVLAGAYGLAWLGLNVVLLPRTGRLRLPVVVYGAALAAMALAALDTGSPAIAAGGAAFLISDSILALDTFDAASLPGADGLVMLTYAVAQALIAGGLTAPV